MSYLRRSLLSLLEASSKRSAWWGTPQEKPGGKSTRVVKKEEEEFGRWEYSIAAKDGGRPVVGTKKCLEKKKEL
jgi:hypothetical protein